MLLQFLEYKFINTLFVLYFGILVSLLLCKLNKNNYNIQFEFALETMIEAIFIGILGARFYYVVFNMNYYISNPQKIFNIRELWSNRSESNFFMSKCH